jgi:hypothetical protein
MSDSLVASVMAHPPGTHEGLRNHTDNTHIKPNLIDTSAVVETLVLPLGYI